jgi:SAM-dependent methyltransferase
MMPIPSLLRLEEHRALRRLSLDGDIIDIGGTKGEEYLACIEGAHTVTTLNIDPAAKPDIVHDLEKPIPCADASYDHALLINVAEHIYNARQLFAESVRIVKPGGSVVVVVPFLFPLHPSPGDYWRFTKETLFRELTVAGCSDVVVAPLGTGVFSTRYVFLDRLLPYPLRFIAFFSLRYVAYALDMFFVALARALHKKYDPADYALGYIATARKHL